MKRIVLALVLVAVMALPAMAQNVDVTVSGDFWGTFTAPSGDSSFFDTMSWFSPSLQWWDSAPNEYTNVSVNAAIGNNFGFTYTYNVPFNQADQIIGSFMPNAGLVNEVRVGKFQIPIGLNEYINTFGTGAAVLGSIGVFNYNLGYFTESEFQDAWVGDDAALNLKLETTAGALQLGATIFHDSDDANIFGVDARTSVGPFGLRAEYLFVNLYDSFREKDLFLSGSYAYTDRTTFFADYYNAEYNGNTYDANKLGVTYQINDNASLRAMFVNGADILGGRGFETALRVTF